MKTHIIARIMTFLFSIAFGLLICEIFFIIIKNYPLVLISFILYPTPSKIFLIFLCFIISGFITSFFVSRWYESIAISVFVWLLFFIIEVAVPQVSIIPLPYFLLILFLVSLVGGSGLGLGTKYLFNFYMDKVSETREENFVDKVSETSKENFVDKLIKSLIKGDTSEREYAAKALGNLENEKAVEPLIAALSDEEDSVRLHAVKALGKIGAKEAIEPLRKQFEEEQLMEVKEEIHETMERINKKKS